MLAIDLFDQLEQGTFEHALHYLVENRLDLSIYNDQYKNDLQGRPAFHPAILLKIVLFAYSKGITSSREIAWCCQKNIVFKALSCDTEPHYTTIAHFISAFPEQNKSLFEQVLLICDQEGLLGKELFAIDGCKLPSDASKSYSGTFEELARKRQKIQALIQYHSDLHKQHDQHQETLDTTQLQTLKAKKQSIATLEAQANKIQTFLDNNTPRIGDSGKEVKSNITDNDSAKMTTSKGTIQGYNGIATVDKKHQIVIHAEAFGKGPEQHTLVPILDDVDDTFKRLKIDESILQKVIITADTGFAMESNMKHLHEHTIDAYIPDNQFRSRDPKFKDQKIKHPRKSRAKADAFHPIPASEFHYDPILASCICPNNETLKNKSISIDRQGFKRLYFRASKTQCMDCTLNTRCMKNPPTRDNQQQQGRQVSYRLGSCKKATYTDWMARRIDSEKGKQIYGHRMSVVEPVFGNVTSNKHLNRFSLRGIEKVNAQWRLFCMVQNIEKLAKYSNWGAKGQ